jgi:hypothetical protein
MSVQSDLESKRQSLFASLLKYSPETGPLRERALERLVLVGLLGSTHENPYRVGEIQNNLKLGPHCPEIRPAVINQALQTLMSAERVHQTQLRSRNAYYLAPVTETELAAQVEASSALFMSILRRMLQNTDYMVPFEDAAAICRTFICQCFARFGLQLAKTVIGDSSLDDLIRLEELREAFAAATQGKQLSDEAWASLQGRCIGFIRSKDPDDEKLKFYLTQGFFFAQLLGLETRRFNPLAEGAFAGAMFYLDTNVLIPRILASGTEAEMFDEMTRLARRNGIELRVTRATINELRCVAADRETEIKAITAVIPVQLSERTSDSFLENFLNRRGEDPSLTVEAFIEPFMRVEHILTHDLAVTVDEHTEDDLHPSRAIDQAGEIIQAETKASRRLPKPAAVLRHDLLHYSLVMDARAGGRKAWFLTMDGNMLKATAKLNPDQPPAAFSFVGLLQSISPFVANAGAEHSLVDVFSALLTDQVMPTERLFDIQELKLVAEMHEDILSTPPEQLVQAFDYVKSAVLHGHAYRLEDHPKVALGLRKFLSASADERQHHLEMENQRLRAEAERQAEEGASERHRREAVEQEAKDLANKVAGLEEETARQATLANSMREKAERTANRRRFRQMIYGFAAGAALWLFGEGMVAHLISRWPTLSFLGQPFHALIGAGGVFLFTLPSVAFVKYRRWRAEIKVVFLTLVFSLAIGLSRVLDDKIWSAWSAYVQIAALLANGVIFGVEQLKARQITTR